MSVEVSFRFGGFRFGRFRFVSADFVSFLFRFALYRYAEKKSQEIDILFNVPQKHLYSARIVERK